MTPETHADIRTAAAAIVALALVVAAWSVYRVAEAEEEQACWARINAVSVLGQTQYPGGISNAMSAAAALVSACEAL